MRFWGWGEDAHAGDGLPGHAVDLLRGELGLNAGSRGERVASIDEVRLAPSGLAAGALDALGVVVGSDHVRADHEARVLHAAGKSLPDLLRLRGGHGDPAPDAVVSPAGHEEVAGVLAVCAAHAVAVVPFGGGTSVVGGVEPLRGKHGAVIALDLTRLRSVDVDRRSLLARAGPGLLLGELEAQLRPHGVTLGHFPQSYEHATVGGCVATRSAGQASTGYGRIDRAVVGVAMAAPSGDLDLPAIPGTAAGPDLRQLVVGSEGTFGVITGAALRVHPLPRSRRYEGYFFSSFDAGAEAFRRSVQAGAAPDVARLSDEEETRLSLALSGTAGLKGAALDGYLRLRRVHGGCLAILGWEGEPDAIARRRSRTLAAMRGCGAVPIGSSAGRAWERGRFHGPYLRDDLLDLGVVVETLETAHTWAGLQATYRAVGEGLRSALGDLGTPPLVMCHISHLYPTGASLYFTWMARALSGREMEQWAAAKAAASDAIVASGATITHHHAVGRDHMPWLGAETGELGLDVLREVKARLDPAQMMNPGKLLI